MDSTMTTLEYTHASIEAYSFAVNEYGITNAIDLTYHLDDWKEGI